MVIFFLDPPYISSHFECYKSDYWDLAKFAELEKIIFNDKHNAFVLFGSEKSDTAFFLEHLKNTRQEAMKQAYLMLDPQDEQQRELFMQELVNSFRPLYRISSIMQSISKYIANPSEYSLDNFEWRLNKK